MLNNDGKKCLNDELTGIGVARGGLRGGPRIEMSPMIKM